MSQSAHPPRRLALLALATMVVTSAAVAFAQPAAEEAPPEERCHRGYRPPYVRGEVENPFLTDLTGLVASRRQAGVLWSIQDRGHSPTLFALGPDGQHLGSYHLQGIEAVDWEGIALVPGRRRDVLVIADTGDDTGERRDSIIVRVPEPEVQRGTDHVEVEGASVTRFRYHGGMRDVEALVAGSAGELYLIARGIPELFLVPSGLRDGAQIRRIGELRFEPGTDPGEVTGADTTAEGDVLVRTERGVYRFRRRGARVASALSRLGTLVPTPPERHGEAIAAVSGGYVTIGQGARNVVYMVPSCPARARRR